MDQAPVPQSSSAGCLARLFWMAAGNVILFFCLAYLFNNRVRGLCLVDIGYWLTVVALIAVRWVDIAFYRGSTATDEPATLADWNSDSLDRHPVGIG